MAVIFKIHPRSAAYIAVVLRENYENTQVLHDFNNEISCEADYEISNRVIKITSYKMINAETLLYLGEFARFPRDLSYEDLRRLESRPQLRITFHDAGLSEQRHVIARIYADWRDMIRLRRKLYCGSALMFAVFLLCVVLCAAIAGIIVLVSR